MDLDQIAELLEPFLESANDQRLTTNDLEYISTYIDILVRWNARINLTAIRDPKEIVTRHFGESFFAARHLFPREGYVRQRAGQHGGGQHEGAALQGRVADGAEIGALAPEGQADDRHLTTNNRVADIGSGAGFPGIPIKLWAPHISLTLIESNQKKATFLREIARVLTLTDVNIQTARAETLNAATFDLVTLRAVERFEAILPIAASLVTPGGRLALLIGSSQFDQARAASPQLLWSEPIPIQASRSRILTVAQRSV